MRLRVAISALHLTRLLSQLEADRPLYCRTTVLELARRMDVLCGTGQSYSVRLHLAVNTDVLRFVQPSSAGSNGGRMLLSLRLRERARAGRWQADEAPMRVS